VEGVALVVVAVAVAASEEAEDVGEGEGEGEGEVAAVGEVEVEGADCPGLQNVVSWESQDMVIYEAYCGDDLGTHRAVGFGWRITRLEHALTACTDYVQLKHNYSHGKHV